MVGMGKFQKIWLALLISAVLFKAVSKTKYMEEANPQSVKEEILFEGYSKIFSAGKHVGFSVSKYEHNASSNRFYGAYYTKISIGKLDITESLKAVADGDLKPIEYQYTSKSGEDTKIIDGKVVKSKDSKTVTLVASINENGKIRIEKTVLKSNYILSNFLTYFLLKSETGMQSKTNYSYFAIAEEDGKLFKGTLSVGQEEIYNGIKVFKINNTFKDVEFESYVNDRGHLIASESKGLNLKSELVASAEDAIGKMTLPKSNLKAIFGVIPEGKVNAISQKTLEKSPGFSDDPGQMNGKKSGIPSGKGIMLKKEEAKSIDNSDSKKTKVQPKENSQ